MRVLICRAQDDAADRVSRHILDALSAKPELVLGLATGSTPIPVYQRLRQAVEQGRASFAEAHSFNLDEYVGLSAEHPQSYRHFMQRELFDGIDLDPARRHFPPTEGSGLAARCADFEAQIRALGGIDVQLLGIGSNGHIGFNEPTSSLASRTRLKTLTHKTLEDNARFYADGEVQPAVAATMGIGTILESKEILLQAFGEHKARAVHAAIEGPLSSFWPASALQLHAHTTFFVDEAAASLLTMRDYYAQVQASEAELRRGGRL